MRVILTGGGTGGHIYPALALARYIKSVNKDAELLFVGAAGAMEEKLIPEAGFPLETLRIRGLSRKLNAGLVRTVFLMGRAVADADNILSRFRPQFVVGMGGYAAAPLSFAALCRGIKVIIHEQNVIPGLTNRLLAPLAHKVCISFASTRCRLMRRSNVRLTGNPRASEMAGPSKEAARSVIGMLPGVPLLLAVGGSQGAAVFNHVLEDFLLRSAAQQCFQVLYVTGSRYHEEVVSRLKALKIPEAFGGRLQVHSYMQDMPLAMAAADLIVTRAGATTIAEITALGLPAVLVPSPNVVNNHQLINGMELSRHGAALLLEEKNLNGPVLHQEICRLFQTPGELDSMAKKSRMLGHPGAAEQIYRLMCPSDTSENKYMMQ